MIVQNSEWFAWPPPLLRAVFPLRAGDRLVQVVDVGLVVLAVVDLHRARVDRRLERVVVVRQRRKLVGHWRLLLWDSATEDMLAPAPEDGEGDSWHWPTTTTRSRPAS
jgi:hypothetical protein